MNIVIIIVVVIRKHTFILFFIKIKLVGTYINVRQSKGEMSTPL